MNDNKKNPGRPYSHRTMVISLLSLVMIITISGILVPVSIAKNAVELETILLEVEASIRTGNWDSAENKLNDFNTLWKKTEIKWSMITDHFEIDNINEALSRLESYVKEKETVPALGEGAEARQYIRHIPEKESFLLKNVL